MAGLYVHIPFCRSRCIYCGFYSSTALDLRQTYVEALVKELQMRAQQTLATIYLGGGTPSQLTPQQLRQLFRAIYIYNKVEPNAEVTIEVNPDDVTPEFVAALQQLPVNRVSMGVQTFSDARLRWLRRRHTSAQVSQAVSLLRQAGIRNISIDLMYGFPDETLADWQSDITSALALGVEHISAYCLTIEEGTPLHQMMLPALDEELERQMYYTLIDRLEAAGYEHYEISNFAQTGFRSRHNSSYWSAIPYIGIGAAAHSYDVSTRSWNVSDIRQYIDAINRGQRPYEEEIIDADTRYNDAVTVALRTREGLPLSTLTDTQRTHCLNAARPYLANGLLRLTPDSHLALTRDALFISDLIMSDLMFV